jgi:alkylated DNA repair protein alkB homolog 6
VDPRLDALGVFNDAPHKAPNHVLINEYQPGQGIMAHEDGAAYFPLVATVSLGGAIVLDLYEKQRHDDADDDRNSRGSGGESRRPRYRILQEPRSLLVTTGSLYTEYLHGIAEREIDDDVTAATIANWELLRDRERYAAGGGSYRRQTRTSLTYRDVLKVRPLGKSLGFLSGRG